MTNDMKAWHVFEADPADGALLVYETTRNRARMYAMQKGPYNMGAYVDVRARRSKEHDSDAVVQARVVEMNDELPDGVSPFYDDEL